MERYCPYVPSGSHVSSENCETQEGHGLGMSVAIAIVTHKQIRKSEKMTENIEDFLILDCLSLIQLSSCERAWSSFSSSSKHGE
jgi:hypothetical protein